MKCSKTCLPQATGSVSEMSFAGINREKPTVRIVTPSSTANGESDFYTSCAYQAVSITFLTPGANVLTTRTLIPCSDLSGLAFRS